VHDDYPEGASQIVKGFSLSTFQKDVSLLRQTGLEKANKRGEYNRTISDGSELSSFDNDDGLPQVQELNKVLK
jgi:hypothetical protein